MHWRGLDTSDEVTEDPCRTSRTEVMDQGQVRDFEGDPVRLTASVQGQNFDDHRNNGSVLPKRRVQ